MTTAPPAHLADRRLSDPGAMRALAHPLRLAMLRRLRTGGPSTATILAAELGDSVPSASYHLRQLARFGFVEDENRPGNARERWWRAVSVGETVDVADLTSPEQVLASSELGAAQVRHAARVALRHLDASGRGDVEPELMAATWLSASGLHLTEDEAVALHAEFRAIVGRYRARVDPAHRPAGTRLFNMAIQLVPWDGR